MLEDDHDLWTWILRKNINQLAELSSKLLASEVSGEEFGQDIFRLYSFAPNGFVQIALDVEGAERTLQCAPVILCVPDDGELAAAEFGTALNEFGERDSALAFRSPGVEDVVADGHQPGFATVGGEVDVMRPETEVPNGKRWRP